MARSRDDAEVHQHDLDRTPLARFGAPEEIADAVPLLTSVTWMTGQTVYVDGGLLASGLACFGQARAKLTGGRADVDRAHSPLPVRATKPRAGL